MIKAWKLFAKNSIGFCRKLACNLSQMKTLAELGEDAVVSRLTNRLKSLDHVVVGPGDDCAVVALPGCQKRQLLKTDCLVEGVHYLPNEQAGRVGWKLIARVVSDFAAMGGRPADLLVTVAVPSDTAVEWLEDAYDGMQRCAELYGASICGGETSSVPEGSAAMLSVAGTGWVVKEHLVTRSGGRVGDAIMVTSLLGGSIKGKHLDFTPRLEEADWLVKHFLPHAMMDLSDGVAMDLPRMAEASQCGFRIQEENIPITPGCDIRQALEDGEDYELMFAMAPGQVESLMAAWQQQFPDLPLSVIGELCEPNQSECFESTGWEHFKHGTNQTT